MYRWLLARVAVLVELRLVGLPRGFDERRILLEECRSEDMWACGDRNVEIQVLIDILIGVITA